MSVNQRSVWWEIVHFATLEAISKCKYCQQRNYSNHSNAQKKRNQNEKKDVVQKNQWNRSQSKSTCSIKMGDGKEQRLESKCKCYGDAAKCYTVCIKCCAQCAEYKTTHTQQAPAAEVLHYTSGMFSGFLFCVDEILWMCVGCVIWANSSCSALFDQTLWRLRFRAIQNDTMAISAFGSGHATNRNA